MAAAPATPSIPGPGFMIDGRYRITKKIGAGAFGEVYLVKNVNTGEELAAKLENVLTTQPQLHYESRVYKNIEGGVGIPRTYYYGQAKGYNVLVMDHLGPGLDDLFDACDQRFRLKTVLMLADQMIDRLEFLHSTNFIHRDVKPENFLMGLGNQAHILYMIDYGMAKRYRDPTTLEHIEFRADKGFTGTSRYAPINAHQGFEQSRRDDLEALGYLFVYFLKGSLPWQGLTAATVKQKNDKVKEMKISTALTVLCQDLPADFVTYLTYCRNLQFEQAPDYQYLSSIFRRLFYSMKYEYDNIYDWTRFMRPISAPPAGPSRQQPQPPRNTPVTRQVRHDAVVQPTRNPPPRNSPARKSLVRAPAPPPPRRTIAAPPPPPRRNTMVPTPPPRRSATPPPPRRPVAPTPPPAPPRRPVAPTPPPAPPRRSATLPPPRRPVAPPPQPPPPRRK